MLNSLNDGIQLQTSVFKQFQKTILSQFAFPLQVVYFPLSPRGDVCEHVVDGLVVFFSSLDLNFEIVDKDEKFVEVFALQNFPELIFAPEFGIQLLLESREIALDDLLEVLELLDSGKALGLQSLFVLLVSFLQELHDFSLGFFAILGFRLNSPSVSLLLAL